MASARIKGITIDIGGDATRLNKALEQTERKLYGTQAALKDVNKLLKLDPTNTELLAQKHTLLQRAIGETEGKLKTLKTASEQAAKTSKNYDAWKAAYTPVQEQVVKTNEKIDKLKQSMKTLEESGKIDTQEYKNLQIELDQSTSRMQELKAQKKQIDDEFGKPISPEAFDALQREIAETEINLKKLKDTTGSSSATLAGISETTGKFGKKATETGKKLLPLTVAIGGVGVASTSMANNFNDSMSQAAGALNMPLSKMEDLRQLAIKTGQDTIFSATDAGNAITELAKGGLSEAEIKAGALQTTMDLAASSGMDLGSAANVVVQSMGAFGLSADESARAANALAGAAAASSTGVPPLTEALSQCAAGAKNAGWDIQETTAVLGRFADAGVTGSDAGTSLKTMLRRLSAPTDEAARKIESLGIQTRDSGGELLGASAMAEELQAKLGGLDSASRDAALSSIFGSDAMRAATIMMDSGAKGLEKYISAAGDQEAAQRMANAQMGDGSRAMEELRGSLETAAIQIGDVLTPTIKTVAEFVTELINKFSGLPSGVQQAIVVMGALIFILGPLLMAVGQMSLGISAITGALSKLTGLGGVIAKFGGLVKAVLSGIMSAVKGLFTLIATHPVIAIITVIIAALVFLYTKCEWFRDGVHAVISAVIEFFKNLGKNAVKVFDAMVSGIKGAVSRVYETVKKGFQKAIDFITSLPGKAVKWGKDFIDGLVNGIKSAVGKVVDVVSGVAKKISSFLHFSRPDKGPLHYYEEWMPDFMDGLAKGIDQNAYKVMSSVKRVAQFMSGEMSGGLQMMADPGGQVVNVSNDVVVQIGDEQFDAHVVEASQTGIGNKQHAGTRARGGRIVRNN